METLAFLATGSTDRTVQLFDVPKTGTPLANFHTLGLMTGVALCNDQVAAEQAWGLGNLHKP